jgi:hypothetical protein
VIAKPPFPLKLDDGVMRGPTLNRLQYAASVCEWAEGTVADGIHDLVCIAGTVAEIVLVTFTMHPRRFEEPSIVVAGVNWACRRCR